MSRSTRPRGERSIRHRLERVVALALAGPIASVAGCRAAEDPAPGKDGGAAALDAESDVGLGDGGAEAGVSASACAPEPRDAAEFGDDGACGAFVRLPCGIPSDALRGEGCYPNVDLCVTACPSGYFFLCNYPAPTCVDGGLVPDADIVLECSTCPGNMGRRPAGWSLPTASATATPLGAYFAAAACLEAASVLAFRDLRARLRGFGAPARLRRGAARAKRDERRHARITARLARRHGATPEPIGEAPRSSLGLEPFVLENAVEGCVHETFAAAVALYQAARAEDPEVARALRTIAADEARHAALAWHVHAWASPKLSVEARARVRAAQLQALATLHHAPAPPAELARAAGAPSASARSALAEHFARAFFGRAVG